MKPGGKKLKTIKFPKRIIALLCGAVLCLGGLATAFAAEDDPFIGESDPVIVTDSPIYTDPPIVTDPPIETIPIPTDPPETEPATEGGGGMIDYRPDTTEFVPPTIPKTVSEKSYSTNYAFGIISWICVLVGVIVIISVAASTKASAYRSRRRI